jgi:hypothetical protein
MLNKLFSTPRYTKQLNLGPGHKIIPTIINHTLCYTLLSDFWLFTLCLIICIIQNINFNIQNHKSIQISLMINLVITIYMIIFYFLIKWMIKHNSKNLLSQQFKSRGSSNFQALWWPWDMKISICFSMEGKEKMKTDGQLPVCHWLWHPPPILSLPSMTKRRDNLSFPTNTIESMGYFLSIE